jgi:hypothetical protein
MGAKLTVLTHFSQRYASAPASSSSSQCAVAFDFLSFSLPTQGGALPGATAALAAVLEGLHTSTGIRKSKEGKQEGREE